MLERLSALDGSFLRVETANAHMHVAWSATFRPLEGGAGRPTLAKLRASIAARLDQAPRFRRQLAFPPLGGEPFWVDADGFDLRRHVVALGGGTEELDDRRFTTLCDRALSEPLDRSQPLWRIYLAPRLTGGRAGLVAKIHHALVDGKSAVEIALLLFDTDPSAKPPPAPGWEPGSAPSGARLTAEVLRDGAGETLRAARGLGGLATSPRAGSARIAGTLRRAALAVGDDLARPAPASFLNVPIGPARTLVRHQAPLESVKGVRRVEDVTLNDVCLAMVAGALRDLSLRRRETPRPLKAMVPVSTRAAGEEDALGNRISLVFIDLPLQVSSPRARLRRINDATRAFKRDGKAAGAEAVLSTLGLLPDPLRGLAARTVGSARAYNLTVSNVPGPSFPLYMLGWELIAAHPVVPIAEDHALSVGIFSYRDKLNFGLYADPAALPDVHELPTALNAALLALRAGRGPRKREGRPSIGRPSAATGVRSRSRRSGVRVESEVDVPIRNADQTRTRG